MVFVVKPDHFENHDIPELVKFAHLAVGLGISDHTGHSNVETAEYNVTVKDYPHSSKYCCQHGLQTTSSSKRFALSIMTLNFHYC